MTLGIDGEHKTMLDAKYLKEAYCIHCCTPYNAALDSTFTWIKRKLIFWHNDESICKLCLESNKESTI